MVLGVGRAVRTALEQSVLPGRWPGVFPCSTGDVTERLDPSARWERGMLLRRSVCVQGHCWSGVNS